MNTLSHKRIWFLQFVCFAKYRQKADVSLKVTRMYLARTSSQDFHSINSQATLSF